MSEKIKEMIIRIITFFGGYFIGIGIMTNYQNLTLKQWIFIILGGIILNSIWQITYHLLSYKKRKMEEIT